MEFAVCNFFAMVFIIEVFRNFQVIFRVPLKTHVCKKFTEIRGHFLLFLFLFFFLIEAWHELYENAYIFVFRYITIIVLNNAVTMCCDDEMSYNVNKVSPDGYVQTKQHGRKNGWTWPWHPLQIVGWFFLILFAVTHFSIIVFYLPLEWKAAGIIVSFLILYTWAQLKRWNRWYVKNGW